MGGGHGGGGVGLGGVGWGGGGGEIFQRPLAANHLLLHVWLPLGETLYDTLLISEQAYTKLQNRIECRTENLDAVGSGGESPSKFVFSHPDVWVTTCRQR